MSIVLFDIFFIWEEEKLLSLIMFITNKEKTIPSYVAKMHIPVSLAMEIPKLTKNGDKHKAIRPVWFGERRRRTTNKTQSSISNTLTAQYRRSTAKARKKGTFSSSQMSRAKLCLSYAMARKRRYLYQRFRHTYSIFCTETHILRCKNTTFSAKNK